VSTQELDVRKSWRAVRRHRRMLAGVAMLGVLGGAGFGLLNPPMHSATSLVVLPPPTATAANSNAGTAEAKNIDTHVFIAGSEPVLRSAGQNVSPPLNAELLRERVKVTAVTGDVIEIKAKGTSARQAMTTANAVANVYLVYVTTDQKLPGDLGKRNGARMLEEATTARGGNWFYHLGLYGGLGGLAGALAAVVAILAVARGDRRLRLRDEIADAVGIPVLASVSSYRAKDPADWANLLERYNPSAVDAWSLRKTLHRLELDVKAGTPVSLAVITFTEDERARPLGPMVAAFARSIGIPTSIVVHTDYEGATPLLVEEDGAVLLDVELIVVDRAAPVLAGAPHTTRTVIGLSAGAVTAEELARLAVAAATDDRSIDGLIVADPDPTDRTIGRVAQGARRPGSRLPTLLTGTARGTTR
jgi:capsular polysaccharide biosynthesis protein